MNGHLGRHHSHVIYFFKDKEYFFRFEHTTRPVLEVPVKVEKTTRRYSGHFLVPEIMISFSSPVYRPVKRPKRHYEIFP